jgi:hypothetical protein
MTSHDLTLYLVSGLGVVSGFCASTLLMWLRSDIRNLAEAIRSLRKEHDDTKKYLSELHGYLKGKGLLD